MTTEIAKPKAQHKVKKGETLDKIAKKYGFADPDDIWKYPKNAALVKERRKPDALQPDDVVVIPAYNDEERKEIQERSRKYAYAANMEKLAASIFADQAKAYRGTADRLAEIVKEHSVAGAAYIREYEASVKKADNWSQGVDMANTVIGILGALGKIVAKSAEFTEKTLTAAVKEADATYKELVTEAAGFVSGPVTSEITKQTGKLLTDEGAKQQSAVGLFLGQVLESYGKMNSPSFWGQTFVMLREGKSWSEAASYDLQRDAKDMVAQMKAEQAQVQKAGAQRIAEARRLAAEAEKAAKNAQKKQKEFTEEARRR